MLLESAATEKSPDQGLDVGCCSLLVLLSFPFLPGLPGFVQELGLGDLRYTKHRAPWKRKNVARCTTKLYSDHPHGCIGDISIETSEHIYSTLTTAQPHTVLSEHNSELTCGIPQMKILSGL